MHVVGGTARHISCIVSTHDEIFVTPLSFNLVRRNENHHTFTALHNDQPAHYPNGLGQSGALSLHLHSDDKNKTNTIKNNNTGAPCGGGTGTEIRVDALSHDRADDVVVNNNNTVAEAGGRGGGGGGSRADTRAGSDRDVTAEPGGG